VIKSSTRSCFPLWVVCLLVIFVLAAPRVQAKFVPGFEFEEDPPVVKEKSAAVSKISGRTWIEPVTGMAFVWVPAGCFEMGSNHKVCMDGFWIGKYEVTQGQWKKIMGNNPSYFKRGDRFPVENVSWDDAKKFISVLGRKSKRNFTLPSEAQWEYAARSGGKNEKYSGGNDPNRVGWYDKNSGKSTHEVGTKASNGLGIYDMSGNLLEWCEDVYDKKAYSKYSGKNPMITSGGAGRVLRGGSWSNRAGGMRCAYRGWFHPSYRYQYFGLRLVFAPGHDI